MGNVKGKKVLDLACGEGRFARFFASARAEVTGIDISEDLIKAALEEENRHPLGIEYLVSDAANLDMFDSESFDVAYCYMALMDIRDYEGTISEAARVLRKGGRFIVIIIHPCFNFLRVLDGKMVSGWDKHIHENGTKEFLRYWLSDYFRRHSYTFEWKHDRLPSSFVTTGFHRTLSDYINAIADHGLIATRLLEPQPLTKGIELHPAMKKHQMVPFSLGIEATKPQRN